MQIKLTTSQLWLIHSLEVLAAGGLLTAVLTIYTAFHAGNVDLTAVGVAAGGAIVAVLANGYKGIVNNTQTAQAIADSISELTQAHNGFVQQLGHLSGLITGLMHITAQNTAPVVNQVPLVTITPTPTPNATVTSPGNWQVTTGATPPQSVPQAPFQTRTFPPFTAPVQAQQ
jgi:predicted histidine transporter YuiF (NhaC family)